MTASIIYNYGRFSGGFKSTPKLGAYVLNKEKWNTDKKLRMLHYKTYIPFVKEEQTAITLQNAVEPENTVEIPALTYTQETPVLKEEYDNYSLVQFVPLSLWNQMAGQPGNTETDTYIRILGKDFR